MDDRTRRDRFSHSSERNSSEGSILEDVIDERMENHSVDQDPTLRELAQAYREQHEKEVDAEVLVKLLEQMREPFASTADITAALGCAPEAARHILSQLESEMAVKRHSVTDDRGNQIDIWLPVSEDTATE